MSLRAYYDGSGKANDHPIITFGGFVADCAVCEAIEDDWQKATGGAVFHFADFGTDSCQLGSGSWSDTTCVAFLKRLGAIVNRPDVLIVSGSLEVGPYSAFLAKSPHVHVHGPADSACAQSVARTSEILLEIQGRHTQKVAYIFEKGDRQHEIAKMFGDWEKKSNSVRSRLRSLSFQDKSTTLLQPADLIAGVVQRCLMSAYEALPNLDNGKSRTALHTFESHYSTDGVTASVVAGHDTEHCWVMNQKIFEKLDDVNSNVFKEYPEVLKKRLKQAPYRLKTKSPKRQQ
ncbi:MAG TPA: hypothetical protein VMH80_04780 [Bryobacteraceae bacterium]|nr:hypothetical protein [Bryobacteraceae bacterium]